MDKSLVARELSKTRLLYPEMEFGIYEEWDKVALIGYSGTGSVINIPSCVSIIGKQCFNGNENIRTVHIWSTDRIFIFDSAFQNCSSLEEVIIHSSMYNIGENAFRNCHRLRGEGIKVVTSKGADNKIINMDINEYILQDVCNGCMFGYKKERFNCICTNAFVNAGNIVDYELVIPDGVNVINDHAFTGARFKRLEIPDTVTFIGEYVFFNAMVQELVIKSTSLNGLCGRTFMMGDIQNVYAYENMLYSIQRYYKNAKNYILLGEKK